MRQRLRSHLTHANVMVTILALITIALLAAAPSASAASLVRDDSPGDTAQAPVSSRIAFGAHHTFGAPCPPGSLQTQGTVVESGIFTMNPDGSDAKQLIHVQTLLGCNDPDEEPDLTSYNDPTFAPDGGRIAFTKDVSGGRGFFTDEIQVMRADGTGLHLVTKSAFPADSEPAFSPGGGTIAFVRARRLVFLMRADGSDRRSVSPHGNQPLSPTFFPSGRRIAFSRFADPGVGGGGIFTIRKDGTRSHRLARGPRFNGLDVSPSGEKIAFDRADGDYFSHVIWLMRADGTGKHRVSPGFDPAFSPSGTRIAFAGPDGYPYGNKIKVMRRDGSHLHSVIPDPLPFGVADAGEVALAQPSWGPTP